jgi:hypothetical protein
MMMMMMILMIMMIIMTIIIVPASEIMVVLVGELSLYTLILYHMHGPLVIMMIIRIVKIVIAMMMMMMMMIMMVMIIRVSQLGLSSSLKVVHTPKSGSLVAPLLLAEASWFFLHTRDALLAAAY